MSNFGFLKTKEAYALFASACIEAEKIFATAPAMCAVGCRKALELAVKWVYAADNTIQMPYRDNLQSLIHEPSFRFATDSKTWGKLPLIVKLGNSAVHTGQSIKPGEALAALKGLFEFVQWIDYCYGEDYEERTFDLHAIPVMKMIIDAKKIKAQESLLGEKEAEIAALQKKIEAMSATLTAEKEQHQEERHFEAEDLTEFKTRKIYIDVDMKLMGWHFEGPEADVQEEYPVEGMAGVPGKQGYVDYVLFGKDGRPLAVVEAKRTSADPNAGRKQAMLYADCLERKFGCRPMMFTTNGFETYFWDDTTGPQRKVSGIFSKDDLQKLMYRRQERLELGTIPINDAITDRYYQKAAIRAVGEEIGQGFRKHLLVMATGTGKTRTAASLVDVLSRGKHVTNILFLADRTALVKQARDDFKNYLPDMSLCNLCSNKDDRQARIVFSTYPTMLNGIDAVKSKDGLCLFTPAHFDLIIVDECHRSIFKKYRTIFEYFDAHVVGLTATPKTDVDHDVYAFFEKESGVPTYAYDYETAVYQDHVLVPYYNYEVKTKFLEEGITYDQLSAEDKARYEDDFAEDDGSLPDFIPSAGLNTFVFNEKTVDTVLQDLMTRGIKVAGGDRLGKTIVFAQNKRHAEFILERFNKLYPGYNGVFAQRVVCTDAFAQTVIDDFKIPEKNPHIVVSVDMMDTGIDVPECVNLVFFKKVRSKAKFWQMIGRGTRLCRGLTCVDQMDGEYTDKRRFLIFDYCGNFEYFREHIEDYKGSEARTLAENIFCKRIDLAIALQKGDYASEDYQRWRSELIAECHRQVEALNPELIAVRLHRQYVEKYRHLEAFTCIDGMEPEELKKEIAPLVTSEDKDEFAKRFDNFMYGLMLVMLQEKPGFENSKKRLCDTALLLESKASIPQIKKKLQDIQKIREDAFWEGISVLDLEQVRLSFRELLKFLDDPGVQPIATRLSDPILETREGEPLGVAYDFENYRDKVNRYVNEHSDTLAIHKLTHNIQLAPGDYKELERVLTVELGSPEDYDQAFGETPFGLLIRKIAKLDHEAAMQAFSAFINDQSLSQRQIAFVHKIINHIEQNGYMENITDLQKPPFDKPVSFIKLFDRKKQMQLVAAINAVRDNAVKISGL
ncbi:MAG: DEAD/DEAH box helicase family protein [Eubacterium sp.]|nr:DEAD/DEAH box helicase family protein [Eubacterium sp.]